MSKAETCVCCGRIIPEGNQYCVICGYEPKNNLFKSTSDVFVKWQKDIDNAILGEIKTKAIENGIKTEYLLNEKAIINALKKQIPKKPIDVLLTEYKFSWVCPNCKTKHTNEWCGTERKLPYCSICGQKIDWSDTE